MCDGIINVKILPTTYAFKLSCADNMSNLVYSLEELRAYIIECVLSIENQHHF